MKKLKKKDRILRGKHAFSIPMILVGNKQGLENERSVTYNEAKSLADSWKKPYIEISSKTNDICKKAFEILAKNLIEYKYPKIKYNPLYIIA